MKKFYIGKRLLTVLCVFALLASTVSFVFAADAAPAITVNSDRHTITVPEGLSVTTDEILDVVDYDATYTVKLYGVIGKGSTEIIPNPVDVYSGSKIESGTYTGTVSVAVDGRNAYLNGGKFSGRVVLYTFAAISGNAHLTKEATLVADNSGCYFIDKDAVLDCNVDLTSKAYVSGGTFNGDVVNSGRIVNGTFNGKLTNKAGGVVSSENPEKSAPTLNGEIVNDGLIYGCLFGENAAVSGNGKTYVTVTVEDDGSKNVLDRTFLYGSDAKTQLDAYAKSAGIEASDWRRYNDADERVKVKGGFSLQAGENRFVAFNYSLMGFIQYRENGDRYDLRVVAEGGREYLTSFSNIRIELKFRMSDGTTRSFDSGESTRAYTRMSGGGKTYYAHSGNAYWGYGVTGIVYGETDCLTAKVILTDADGSKTVYVIGTPTLPQSVEELPLEDEEA